MPNRNSGATLNSALFIADDIDDADDADDDDDNNNNNDHVGNCCC